MYLSRVKIDVDDRQKIQNLNHLGAYHDWVERSFPEEFDEHVRTRKLWRIDTVNNEDYLMVVSPHRPDIEGLERYGVPGTAQTIDYGKVVNNLQAGMKLRFKATLCPEVARKSAPDEPSKLRPCRSYHDRMEYLIKRAEKNGFSLETPGAVGYNFIVAGQDSEPMYKKRSRPSYIQKVTYEGYLVIQDVDKFHDMLCQGLGKKRAYGCGMFTVARV